MARTSKAQQDTIERVMHAYKEGELESGSGGTVRSRRQAVAIALSEAGASRDQNPAGKRKARRTVAARDAGDRKDRPTKAALYAEARRRAIPGRSTMSRDDLARALDRA